MNKSIAAALLALTLGLPAAAQTYELTFSGTFTKLWKGYSCESCTDGFSEPILGVSIPFSGTLNLTLAAQPTVSVFDRPEHGPFPASHSVRSSLVNQSPNILAAPLDLDSRLTVAHGTVPASEYYQSTSAIDYQKYEQTTTTGEVFNATRSLVLFRDDIWQDSTGISRVNFFDLRLNLAAATPGTFDAPMTSGSFIQTLQSLVGCVSCLYASNQSEYYTMTHTYQAEASGTATLLSIRELASPVPEPSSMLLAACGVAAMAGLAWRRRRQQS